MDSDRPAAVSRARTRALFLAVALVAACALAQPAQAAVEGDPYLNECQTVNTVAPCVAGSKSNTLDAELSPDGSQLYVGSFAGWLLVYDRNTVTGSVNQREGAGGCFNAAGSGGCTALPSLGASYDLTLTPDGRSVLIASTGNGNLVVMDRDTTTGALEFNSCYGPGAGCTATAGVTNAYSVIADDATVYLRGESGLAVFTRNQTTRVLIQKDTTAGCFKEDGAAGCTDAVGIAGQGYQMAMNSQHLYVPFTTPGGVAVFNRFSDGTLTQTTGTSGGCISVNGGSGASGTTPPSGADIECVDGVDGVLQTSYVAEISPAGDTVYVGGNSGLAAYSRHAETGLLTQIDCMTESAPPPGCQDVTGGTGVFDINVVPGGSEVIVTAFGQSAIGFYRRAANGTLTQRSGTRGCFSQSGSGGACETLAGLNSIARIAVASNGMDFYVTSFGSGLVAYFDRDFAPVCSPVAVDVPFNTATSVPLSCSDANGDAITISKGAGPTKGTLADIDQAADTVFYNPFSGITGADSFTYFATARGLDSATATASLNVLPQPDADGDGSPAGTDCNDNNAAIEPGNAEIPDNGVDENCDGIDARTAASTTPPPVDGDGDADGDGVLAGVDCDDSNAGIAPGKTDVPGNGVDENCDGADARATVASTLKQAWRPRRRYTTVKTLTVKNAPQAATTTVTCKGRGCRFKRKRVSSPNGGSVALARFFNFRKNGRLVVSKLRPRTVVTVEVAAPAMIGRRWSFKMRAAKPPSIVSKLVP